MIESVLFVSFRLSLKMNLNDHENCSNETTAPLIFTTSTEGNQIKFTLLLVLQILSIPCFLYIFVQFRYRIRLHRTFHHHAVIALLIVSFIFVIVAVPLTLAYLFTSSVKPENETFCSLWNWLHYSINIVNLFLMGFTSLERHWLIFHPYFIHNKFRRFVFHYLPLLFCLVYPPTFYISAMFIYQCESTYDYTQLLCKYPCYFYNESWWKIDLFFNNYTPLFSIPASCIVIYIRILVKKSHLKQQRFKWRRDKRLVIQIWAISSLYLSMWMPLQLSGLINLFWLPSFLLQAQIDYMYLFPYLVHLIYPYIVLFSYRKEFAKAHRRITSVVPLHN